MKKIVNLLLSLSVLGTLSFANPTYASDAMKVHLNGKEMKFDVNPVVHHMPNGDGITMVEFRPLFEAMGLQVVWTPDNPTQIIGKKDGLIIILHIGSKITMVNGKEIDLTVAPQVINGHTLIPLRFIGEVSGKDVKWTGGTDVEINDVMSSSAITSSTSSTPSVSTSSNSAGETSVTPPSYALKNLQVYWNGTEMVDRGHKVTSFYSPRDNEWYIYFSPFFASFAGIGNLDSKKTENGRIMIAKYNNNTYKFIDNDGTYVNDSKVSDLKFLDYTAASIGVYAKALNFTYTVDDNGVYITSK